MAPSSLPPRRSASRRPSIWWRLTSPVRHLYHWFRGAPRWMQAILLLIVLGSVGSGGYYAFHTRMETLRQRRIAGAWERFNAAIHNGDEEAMRAALADVKKADPGDQRAMMWEQTLDTGKGDPGDPGTVYVSLIQNLRANRLDDAAREAQKRLEHEPKDWLARCVLASAALTQKDREAAIQQLDQLPPPDDRRANVTPSGLLLAFKLFKSLGRDTTPLREFGQNYVLPHLRVAASRGYSASQKVDLIETYLDSFDPPDRRQPTGIQQGWTPAARLADQSLEEALAAEDTNALLRIGRLGNPMLAALRLLQRHGQVDAEQFAELNRELDARTRKAWEALQTRDPKNPESYRGLAELDWRTGTAEGRKSAWESVVQGLQKAGGDPQLYEVFSQILKQLGAPHLAWAELSRVAQNEPDKPMLWVLAADAALAAGRRDLALSACEKIRAHDPSNRWAPLTEARIWLASGFPQKALDLLSKIGEETLAKEPAAARAYSRALTEVGQPDRVEAFLVRLEKTNDPTWIVSGLAGWSEARPIDAERSRKVAARVERLLGRWPENTDLFHIRAESLFLAAERADPPWETARVREALLAAERLRAKLPSDPHAALILGWLRLAENNPERALHDTAPLQTPEADPTLTGSQLELLGAIYRQTGKVDDAIRLLQRAAADPNASAGVFIQLALAYHAQGKLGEAQIAIDRARNRPRSPREHADYVAAVNALRK